MKYELSRGFPPLSGGRAFLQEDSHCQNIRLLIVGSHVFVQNRKIQIHSLIQPVQIDPVRSCDVPYVWASSVGSLPHCLRMSRVGLSVNCWECWAESCQMSQKHKCQNVKCHGMTLSRLARSSWLTG